jgi:urease accessory protein
MLILTRRSSPNPDQTVALTLALTAEERGRSRPLSPETLEGQPLQFQLPRGTILQDGDLLQDEAGEIWVRIIAKPEPVLTVTSDDALTLLRAAYHLGNRHVALEVGWNYLRLEPDPVLEKMLEQLGAIVQEDMVPFQPEAGAYHRH